MKKIEETRDFSLNGMDKGLNCFGLYEVCLSYAAIQNPRSKAMRIMNGVQETTSFIIMIKATKWRFSSSIFASVNMNFFFTPKNVPLPHSIFV